MSKGLESVFIKARNAEKRGEFAEAENLYSSILQKFPNNARALKGMALLRQAHASSPPQAEIDAMVAAYRQGHLADAVQKGEALAAQYPQVPLIRNILGVSYIGLREFPKAEAALRQALADNETSPELYNNLGIALMHQDKLEEANKAFNRALTLKPDYVNAHNNLGNVLKKQGQPAAAAEAYRRAVKFNPAYADAYNNLGMVLQDQGRLDDALVAYGQALSIKPDHVEALTNRGNALLQQGQLDAALQAFHAILSVDPKNYKAHSNCGSVFLRQGRLEAAVQAYRKVLTLKSDEAFAYSNLGSALHLQSKLDEALQAFDQALALDPEDGNALATKWHIQAHICDWSAFDDFAAHRDNVSLKGKAIAPFSMLVMEDNPAHQLERSRTWARATYRQEPLPLPAAPAHPQGKIRIGYFSADFHNHATLYLMAGLLRAHDRQRFEIHAYSYGVSCNDEMRRQIVGTVDSFTDANEMSDEEIVVLGRSHKLDIAIDLKGYTQQTRSRLFAYRMAPIQINYLGYPGSMGAGFMDYLIADAHVVPENEKPFYDEKIIYLPDSYQPNDNGRVIAQTATTRADFGLPEEAFVFCCFNQTYKITPEEFDVWMRLLARAEGSVLWLLRSNRWAEANLCAEAEKRGIDAARIVFADKLPHAEHLARHKHADLFLDTFNVNAHTTTSDALWAGLPVVTRAGRQFAARVSTSLLHAIGLPELVTGSTEDYEALILDLATTPGKLAGIRKTLAGNRLTYPLFNTELYTRRIEAAYQAAHRRLAEGLPPEDIVIS